MAVFRDLFTAKQVFVTAILLSGLLAITLPGSITHAQSVYAEQEFTDPAQEELFRELAAELRCLVCQNQNIADSNAELAQDLRREISTMIRAGDGKTQIIDFMVERYGEFVLYRPLFTLKTVVLWVGPLAFFLTGLLIVLRMARKPREPALEPDQSSLDEARKLLGADTSATLPADPDSRQ